MPTNSSDETHCVKCNSELNQVFFYCEEDNGPFCPGCWPSVNCEERHGEGCAVMVIDTDRGVKDE
jgi:hypothetical protein